MPFMDVTYGATSSFRNGQVRDVPAVVGTEWNCRRSERLRRLIKHQNALDVAIEARHYFNIPLGVAEAGEGAGGSGRSPDGLQAYPQMPKGP